MKLRVLSVLALTILMALRAGIAWAQFDPGVGLCAPLPDLPLVLDWTIRAIKVAIGGEIDCGL